MERSGALSEAMRLSQKILAAIDEQSWEEVGLLDNDRVSLINQYFDNNPNVDAQTTVALKQLNDEIIQQLVIAQQKIRAQQLQLKQSNRASQAYLDNASK